MSGQERLTAILAIRHEVLRIDLLSAVLPDHGFAAGSIEKSFGLLRGLELRELGAAKAPDTNLDRSGP